MVMGPSGHSMDTMDDRSLPDRFLSPERRWSSRLSGYSHSGGEKSKGHAFWRGSAPIGKSCGDSSP
ncbi:MAG: hypothetical protein D6812_10895 [Deltaproteobacteria bacterium]|nr:MAG: hypothetical protein D6812_10895 [Deltaproteobacteria bacterium]